MKVNAAVSFIEPAPTHSTAGGKGTELGEAFDSAVRDVAKDAAKPDRDAKKGESDVADRKQAVKGKSQDAASKSEKKDVREQDPDAEARPEETEVKDTGRATAMAEVLGRLMGGTADRAAAIAAVTEAAVKGPARAEPEADATGAKGTLFMPSEDALELDARLVIAPIGAGEAESAAGLDRKGKVQLEVLKMETHFEPRSDDFVLIEGKAKASVDVEGAQVLANAPTKADTAQLLAMAANTDKAERPAKASIETDGAELPGKASIHADGPELPGKASIHADGPELPGKPDRASADRAAAGLLVAIGASGGRAAGSARAKVAAESDAPGRVRFDETVARLRNGGDGAASQATNAIADKTAPAAEADDSGLATPRRGPENAEGSRSIAAGFDARAEPAASGRVPAEGPSTPAIAPKSTTDGALAASMTGQIANRVIDALRPSANGQPARDLPPGDTHLRLTAGGAALKTLSIQLQPENLGRLDVTMRLIDGQLTLELAATEHETSILLGKDRGGLKTLLEHAGFSVDDAAITIVTRESGASAGPSASGRADANSSDTGRGDQPQDQAARDSSGQDSGAGRNEQRGNRNPSDGERVTSGAPAPAQGRRPGSSVFL